MLYSRDYLMRYAEQIGQMLARVLKAILRARDVDAEYVDRQLQETADRAGLDFVLVRNILPASLVDIVSFSGQLDPVRASILAELLYVSAHLESFRSNHAVALDLFGRSLTVYRRLAEADVNGAGLPSATARIEDICERLGNGS